VGAGFFRVEENMRALIAVLLIAATSPAHSQSATISRIEIVEAGIYQVDKTRTEAAPGTAEGQTNVATNVRLIKATTTVPARIGTTFAVRYRVIGQPTGATVTIKIIGFVPEPGMRNPATGNTTVRNEYTNTRHIGDLAYTSFTFEQDWELLAGKWTFEFWDGNRKLASQDFEVVKP
jgi:hypothetical protein